MQSSYQSLATWRVEARGFQWKRVKSLWIRHCGCSAGRCTLEGNSPCSMMSELIFTKEIFGSSKRGLSGIRVSWAASKRGLSGVRVSWAASKRGLSGVRVSWAASKSVCQGLESAGLLPSGVKVSWAAREVCQGLESAGLLPSGVKVSWAAREVCQGLESAGLLPREVCQGLESAGLQENSSADVALHTSSEVSVGGPWLCVDVLSVEAVIGSTAQVMHGQQVTSYLQQVTFHLQPW